ncbi:hypothetical protein TUM4438_42580 [Shewanella sairae]|uniref:Conjugal transfer protein TraD n=1 Tax=Shewanella sairae TaxID=190310 RepID=A0ABQ4PQZ3_9GAMM|nr:hypothetical protein [Shewanella sairae]MCL1132320.1 hypothetical protein [Shewanella sairae]GIU51774.1 hypothetical protein TUM4438_42580 [Shewanella sairae]
MQTTNKPEAEQENAQLDLHSPISTNELLTQKSQDAETTPGFGASYSPDEAELAGAFVEDALSENDVLDTEELIDEHN